MTVLPFFLWDNNRIIFAFNILAVSLYIHWNNYSSYIIVVSDNCKYLVWKKINKTSSINKSKLTEINARLLIRVFNLLKSILRILGIFYYYFIENYNWSTKKIFLVMNYIQCLRVVNVESQNRSRWSRQTLYSASNIVPLFNTGNPF